ncbi:flagellar basal body rod protein FlgC [bacterium E08(2017)]|nr:flagellar basal body rod protein FlgC [bacterium E08(2017)]
MHASSSGLDAMSRRMEIIANNVANAQTTAGPDGKVYRRKDALFAEKLSKASIGNRKGKVGEGVEFKGVVEDTRPPKRIYRPGHPDADKDGYIMMANVDPMEEMVSMMSCTRAYEANLAAIKASRSMANAALNIGK